MGTLETLKEDIKNDTLFKLAKWIVQYQNYKTKVALNFAPNCNLKEKTLTTYFSNGYIYIKTKKQTYKSNSKLFAFIDKCIENCVTPLRPKSDEKRSIYNNLHQKKDFVSPVQIALKQIEVKSEVEKEVKNVEYGILLDNNIIIKNDEANTRSFIKGIEYAINNYDKLKNSKPQIIKISYEIMEDK